MSYIALAKPIVLAMDGEAQELINSTIRGGFAGSTEDPRALAENIKKVYTLSDQEQKTIGKRLSDYHHAHFERNLLMKQLLAHMESKLGGKIKR